ncbi:toll/interleukin-1 receptor domain-containing protein [Candidatus Binatia bacterium]|nr:toll/interleukin-1 receptor domain-containing protein [Candidatus Binatia bacterium]
MHALSVPALPAVDHDFAVSYSSRDRSRVEPLVQSLRARGYRVFEYIDDLARAWGLPLRAELENVFSGSAAIYVVVMSRHYAAGRWTRFELEQISSSAPRSDQPEIVVFRLDDGLAVPHESRWVSHELGEGGLDAQCDFLGRKLADIESLVDAPPSSDGAVVSGTTWRTLDEPLLRHGISRWQAAGASARFRLRLPPVLFNAIASARRHLAAGIGADFDAATRDKLHAALDSLESRSLNTLDEALNVLMRRAATATWSLDEICSAIRSYFLSECFRLLRILYQQFGDRLGLTSHDEWQLSKLQNTGGSLSIADAMPWACARPMVSFWLDVDVTDADHLVSVRKRVFLPSTTYVPRFRVVRAQLLEYVVPQLLWFALHFDDADSLHLLELDPERLRVQPRGEQIIGTTSFRRDYVSQAPDVCDEASRATEEVLRQAIAAGELNDGFDDRTEDERVSYHLRQLSFLDRRVR